MVCSYESAVDVVSGEKRCMKKYDHIDGTVIGYRRGIKDEHLEIIKAGRRC
jgi:hypothetical protein